MELPLDPTECRLLGVMIEKQMATPDGYPMTPNALLLGANQKNNRRPVTAYEDFEIEGALRSLYLKKWVANTNASGRVMKWLHRAEELLQLLPPAKAVVAELLLRGPQQPGELRANASRLVSEGLETQEALEAVLDSLEQRPTPIVKNLGRRSGERAVRYGHLLGGSPEDTSPPRMDDPAASTGSPHLQASAPLPLQSLEARVQALENEVALLRAIVDVLRK